MLGQLYADDIQVYQHCLASDALVTVSATSRTMEALGSWMSSNRFRLNPHKTQFIWLGTCQQLAKLDMIALTSAFPHFTFSSTVRDLGVTLDQELTLAPHIHSLCSACYYQLRQLRSFPLTYQYCCSHPCPFVCHLQARHHIHVRLFNILTFVALPLALAT